MIKKINHIGIVVEKIDTVLQVFEKAFGAKEIYRKKVPDQKQVSSIVRMGESYLELMEPLSEEGASGKFLKQRGEGIHHISLLCNDVQQTVKNLQKLGIRIIGSQIESEEQIAFVHPKSLHGLLIEITNVDSSSGED